MTSFAATVGQWVDAVEGALEVVFKESVQELVAQLNALVPVDTGFLQASLRASTAAMPVLSLPNPGGSFSVDAGEILLVIAGAEIGDTIYRLYGQLWCFCPLWRERPSRPPVGRYGRAALGRHRASQGG